jgi:ABC-type Fe3+-hydroxamate transport system substrate-binding protein
MSNARRIVICGDSIYMLAIESGLSKMAEGDVVRINPSIPDILERIRLLAPHVVILEQNRKYNQLALEIQSQGIPLVALDEAQGSIKILTGEHPQNAGISELSNLIEKINRKQIERRSENVNQSVSRHA